MGNDYGAEQIKVLEGLTAVRRRPGMYIGTTSSRGLHHLVYEILDNSIDEALAGHCDRVRIELNQDGSVTVKDNGRGIPVDRHSSGVPAVQVVMTQLHAGGKFDHRSGAYKVAGGLHGVGASVVNALSTQLTVDIFRDGYHYQQVYTNGGREISPLEKVGPSERTGTEIQFTPDDQIFETTTFNFDKLANRLQEQAFLNPGLTLELVDGRVDPPKERSFYYEGGLVSFVKHLNRSKKALHPEVIYASGKRQGIEVAMALQYTKGYSSNIYSFVNNIRTVEGGMHESGFKTGLTRIINEFAREKRLLKKKQDNLAGEDIREGLTAVLSLMVPDPQFEGQTKTKLGTSQARPAAEAVTYDGVQAFIEDDYQSGKKIVEKALRSYQAREAARKARELTRSRNGLEKDVLTGKLADCQNSSQKGAEVFLVEGDSAGGSAKQGRDRRFQAILPLRGKILNVEKRRLDRILSNKEIKAVVAALGAGIGDELDMDRLRYERIIIMTDADTDGSHIRTLLLTFFYRYMPSLLKHRRIYIAQPPLYRIAQGGSEHFVYSEPQLDKALSDIPKRGRSVQRYKGLGEMNPSQLWTTTMDPERRTLIRVSVDDAMAADETFSVLMGSKVSPRKQFIQDNALKVSNLDI